MIASDRALRPTIPWLLVFGVALVGVLLRLDTLWVGPISDDYVQQAMLGGSYAVERPAWDLYRFVRPGEAEFAAHRALGTLPWWSTPRLNGGVFRPISSLLLAFDHAIAPKNLVFAHAHGLVWWGAALVCFGALAHRLLPRSMAVSASMLLALEDCVSAPLGWLANRCVIVCLTFACLVLLSHVRWRRHAWRAGPYAVTAAMCGALLAGEYGLMVLGFVVAYEFFDTTSDRTPRARMVGVLPALVPGILYLVLHQVLGYGTIGAEVYADPFDAPLGYLGWAANRIPRLAADLAWSFPASTVDLIYRIDAERWLKWAGTYRRAHLIVAIVLLGIATGTAFALRPALRKSETLELRWLLVGSLLALVPVAVAPAHARLLTLAQIGACPVVGAGLVCGVRMVKGSVETATWRRILAFIAVGALAFFHVVMDPIWARRYVRGLDDNHRRNLLAFQTPAIEGTDGKDVVVIAAQGASISIHGTLVTEFHGLAAPRTWQALSLAPAPHTIRRPAPDVLRLELIGDVRWMSAPGERFFRPHEGFRTGEVIDAGSFVVTIVSVEDGYPSVVDFRFPEPLEHPRWRFVSCSRQGLREVELPAVGGVGMVPIPHIPALPDSERAQPIPMPALGGRRSPAPAKTGTRR